MGITLADDGAAFNGSEMAIIFDDRPQQLPVEPRIGISKAQDRQWHFGLAGATGRSKPFPRRQD